MGRLYELLIIAVFLGWVWRIVYTRILHPLKRGFDEAKNMSARAGYGNPASGMSGFSAGGRVQQPPPVRERKIPELDRSNVTDADFRDIE